MSSNAGWYLIYVKLPGAKRFRPLSGDGLALNRIHAEQFRVDTDEDWARLNREADSIARMNGVKVEIRPARLK